MLKSVIKRILTSSTLCISLLLFASCAEQSEVKLPVIEDYDVQITQDEKNSLRLGVVAGPYGDMFMETIYPMFSQKGYNIELVLYDNYMEPNFALASGELDLNMFQNYAYINNFKFANDLNLTAIAEIPTAPMGIYSYKYDSLDNLKKGSIVAIPNDNTNHSRALAVLNAARIITLDPFVDTSIATIDDIIDNPKDLQFIMAEAQLLTDTLNNCDLAVINGNYAINSGLNLSDALYNEILTDHAYLNVIVVRAEDLTKLFVLDLIAVMDSEEFKNSIVDVNGKYHEFQYPCNFKRYTN